MGIELLSLNSNNSKQTASGSIASRVPYLQQASGAGYMAKKGMVMELGRVERRGERVETGGG